MKIHSKAPTRIDLAGGTVDLWPLYLFLKDPVTLNLGIDLYAETQLEIQRSPNGHGKIRLRSEDQGHQLEIEWSDLETATAPPQLELHLKLLRHFDRERSPEARAKNREFDLTLGTRAKSPAGAGLGGSSTLSVSMAGALATWSRQDTSRATVDALRDGEELIEIVRDVETTVIQVPAGVQDYYGAMFGGLQALRWGAGKHTRSWLPEQILGELEKRILLFYSGQSRNSGINNWALYKSFIDNEPSVRSRFGQITHATQQLEIALRNSDWSATAQAIGNEWLTRRTLAAGITTPEMERAFAAAHEIAQAETAIAGKVCGAGGGGCFFVYLAQPRAEHAEQIEAAFSAQNIRRLPFKASPRGLDIQVSRA